MSRRKVVASGRVDPALYGMHRSTRVALTVLTSLFALFVLGPLVWLLINATKDQAHVYQSFGFWFAGPFKLVDNIRALGQNVSGAGVFLTWLRNTLLYAIAGAVEGPVSAALPGSAIQLHPLVTVIVDEEAAAGLRYADYYRFAWDNRLDFER